MFLAVSMFLKLINNFSRLVIVWRYLITNFHSVHLLVCFTLSLLHLLLKSSDYGVYWFICNKLFVFLVVGYFIPYNVELVFKIAFRKIQSANNGPIASTGKEMTRVYCVCLVFITLSYCLPVKHQTLCQKFIYLVLHYQTRN